MPASAAVARVVVVATTVMAASIFAASAVDTSPLVENLPTTVEGQDLIRTRCSQAVYRPDDQRMCYEALLPYATSINGSYNRATIAGVTAMVSRLKWFVEGNLDDPPVPAECIQVVNDTIAGAKEALAKLGRVDDNVAATNPDLNDVKTWIVAVSHNFDKCSECGTGRWHAAHIGIMKTFLDINDGLVTSSKPFWANSLPSPDESGP